MAVEILGVTRCPGNDLITAALSLLPADGSSRRICARGHRLGRKQGARSRGGFPPRGKRGCAVRANSFRGPMWPPSMALRHQRGSGRQSERSASHRHSPLRCGSSSRDGRRLPRSRKYAARSSSITSAFTPSMQPIMVTSPGRSGSTWLMRMLAQHPDVIVHEQFPYETFACSYWMHFIQVLAAPGDNSQVESLHFWTDPRRLPPFPYFFVDASHTTDPTGAQATLDRSYETDQVEEFARVAQAAVESFYRVRQREKRTTPAFAEKLVPSHAQCGSYAGGGRYSSSGNPGTPSLRTGVQCSRRGRVGGALLTALTAPVARGLKRMKIRRPHPRSMQSFTLWKCRSQYSALVSYEDLVRSPTEHIRVMLDALELDSSGEYRRLNGKSRERSQLMWIRIEHRRPVIDRPLEAGP